MFDEGSFVTESTISAKSIFEGAINDLLYCQVDSKGRACNEVDSYRMKLGFGDCVYSYD